MILLPGTDAEQPASKQIERLNFCGDEGSGLQFSAAQTDLGMDQNITLPPPPCTDPIRQAQASHLRLEYEKRGQPVIASIKAELVRYNFYHQIEVVPGVTTEGLGWAPIFVDAFHRASVGIDFKNKRVLDVGCRDGAMLFIAEQRGARDLVGIDNDASPGLVNFLIPFRRSPIRIYQANLYDVSAETLGAFDLIICCGLLYHLRYPIWGIGKLCSLLRPGGMLVLETAAIDEFEDFPVLYYPLGEASPFEPSSISFFNLAGLQNAFATTGLRGMQVLERFAPSQHDVTQQFPNFGRSFLRSGTIKVTRMIVTASKDRSGDAINKYFEGVHSYHSSGGKGF